MSIPSARSVLEAIGVLQAAPKDEILSALGDANMLSKAHAEVLSPGEEIKDHWTQGQTNAAPRPEEIEFGKPQSASGNGAARMIGDYSNPAPQHGATATVEQLSRDLGSVLVTMRSMQAQQASLETAIAALVAKKAKAESDNVYEDDEPDEDKEMAEKASKKARQLLKEARGLIRKAEDAEEEEEDEDDAEKAKSLRRRAKSARAKATDALARAMKCDAAAKAFGTESIAKAILSVAAKAEIELTKAEDDEDDDEDEKEKAKAAAKAAKAAKAEEAARNQDDKPDEEGNQDDAAKAFATKMAEIDKALNGLGVMQTDMKGMMEHIMARGKAGGVPPVMGKSQVATPGTVISGIRSEIQGMAATRALSSNDVEAAESIIRMVESGAMDPVFIKTRIAAAPPAIKSIFAPLNQLAA
ncbi:MAG: hypothetical protein PHZ23_14735 [Acidiphilium sp.]|nr:hypothetical protein [Acidiphilium sp.]